MLTVVIDDILGYISGSAFREFYTFYTPQGLTDVLYGLGGVNLYFQLAMKQFVMGCDIELPYIDTHIRGQESGYLAKYSVTIDTVYLDVGEEAVCMAFPAGGYKACAEGTFQTHGGRTADFVYHDRFVFINEADYVISG